MLCSRALLTRPCVGSVNGARSAMGMPLTVRMSMAIPIAMPTRTPSTVVRLMGRRTMVPAPTKRTGRLLEYREDRDLPDTGRAGPWVRTFPIFVVVMVLSSLAIFNYQKTSSSVVAATLYALRTNPDARSVLGREIYFRDAFPWVWGTINQPQGRIDIGFAVKGSLGSGFMRFRSLRKQRGGFFETVEWSLELPDGRILQLLSDDNDPFEKTGFQSRESP